MTGNTELWEARTVFITAYYAEETITILNAVMFSLWLREKCFALNKI